MSKQKDKGIIKKGDVDSEDVNRIKENISSPENIKLIAGIEIEDGEGKDLTVLTNRRLLFFKRGEFKLIGEHEEIQDFPLKSIVKINSEPRKNFDLFEIELENGKNEKYMLPKNSGGQVSGIVRDLQTQQKRAEEGGETPLKKLEKLSKLKEEGNITEEEFKERKEQLLQNI